MKKISKFLKGTVLSVMSLCMVFGIVYNVKDGETLRVNADTTSKVYSNEYYTLSYADGEVKFLLSTKVLDYEDLAHKLTEVELAELKDAIISVGYDVMLEGLDFATKFGSSLISRHSANIIDGSQVDITTVTDVIIGQLSDEEAIANALASQGTYDTLLEFYVDRYVSAYEAAGGNGDEAYAGISADLTSAIETAVDQAGLTDVPGFTSTDISSKVDTLVTNAKENEISLNLDEVADVVNLLEDKSVVVDVIKELEIESEVKDIVVTATADQAVNFLTSVDMDTIIEVFNNVSMEKEDVKTVINNVGVDNLVNVVDQIGIDKVKDLANAVDFTKEDLQETITENLTNISITSLLTAIKSINIDGHPLYADKKIQLGGFEAVLRSLPRPSEIATWTDEQMSLTWNLEVETVFGSADLDFTFGFKDDCSKIRSAASKIAEYASFDIVDGVVNVELTTPAKFSDVLLRVANTGHLSDGKKLFVFDNLFDTTLDDVYNKLSDKTYEDYLNLLKDVDYQVIVENVYNAENLNRIFKTEKFTDARLDRMVDEVANFVSHASTITYDRVKSFVGRYYDISALDDTAVETLINKTHELLVKIDSKKFDSALLREFIDPNSEYTSDNIDRYIDKLAKYEDYFNTVMDYVERGYNAAPDRFKDNTVMDFYKGDGTFNYEGAFSLNFEKVLTKLSSTHGSDIYNALEKVLSTVPSSIEVNLTLNLTDIHSVTYNIGSETRVGLLPEGADLEFFADATEVEGYTIHGWVDAQGTQYTSMPNFDVELFPILHSFEVSINEGVEKTYDGVAYTLEATTTPAGNGFGYQWFKDGVAIEGATEATYSVVNVADSGEYYCSVSYYEVTNVTETVSVVINPAVIDLTAWSWTNNGPFKYDGTEKSVTLVTPEAYAELVANGTLVEKVEGNVATNAGSYTATVVVTTTSTNYALEGETSSEAWVINPAVVDLTAWSWTNNGPFKYDGTEKSVTLVTPEAYAELVANGTLVEKVEGNVATNAGSYTATVVVTTTSTNYALEGETSSEAWVINPAVIDLTAWSWTNNGPFTYDGTEKSVALVTPEAYAELVANGTLVEAVEGNVATNADSYTATVVVTTDSTNYALEGETSSEAWVINPAVVDLTAWSWTNNGPFKYDGTEKSVTLVTPEAYAELVANGTLVEKVEGNVATDADSYTATVVVTTTSTNYTLDGETSSEAWVINPAVIDLTKWSWTNNGPFTYDGTEKSVALVTPEAYAELVANGTLVEKVEGNVATDAGSYTATVVVTTTSTNYALEGETSSEAWVIKQVKIPVSGWAWIYEGPFTYDGTEKSVALDIPAEYKELINVAYGEEAKGTAIGTYTATATVTAKDVVNYLVDGTIADLAWEIKEKEILPPSFTLSIEGGVSEVYDVNKTHTLTVTANGDEAYTYTYQWFKDGVAIAGATQSTYTVSVVADSGEYYCVVSVDGTVEETDKVTVEITVRDLDLSQLALDDASHEYTGSQIEVSVLNLDLHADYLALSITQNSTLAASEIGSYDVFVAYSLLNTVDEESVRIVRNGEEQVGIITLTWEIKSNGDGPIIPGGETTKEFVYNENGISIKVSSEQELDADFELKVETVAVFDSELGTVLKAYDIKFLDGANAATLPENNKYTVTIALESAIAAKANLFIIYHPTSGADEKIDATVANGEITFETTHFSIYAVVEPTQEPENPPVKDPVEPKEQPSWWVWVLMGLSVIIIVLLLILILRKREPVVVPVVAEPTVAELSYIVVNENGVELVKLSEAEQEDILSEVPTNEHTIGTVEDEKVTIFKAPRQLRTAIGKIKDYNGNLSILVHRKPYKVVEKLFADQAQDNGEENVQVEVGQIAENDEKVIVKIFKNPRKVD